MPLFYLQPISDSITSQVYKQQQIGFQIKKHLLEDGLPDLEGVKVAFFCIESPTRKMTDFRKKLYSLYMGNWNFTMADLGNLIESPSEKDTYFAIKEMVSHLTKKGITSIVVGGEQHLTYALYRSFDDLEQMVNLVSVDAKFDFNDEEELFSENSYFSRILTETPNNLFDFTNLGYQSYYVAQEELDLLDKMCFDAHRLGNVVNDLPSIEPATRDADLVSVDMTSVQARDINSETGYVNGFSNREICTISRYVGISNNVQVYGIFDIPQTELASELVAEMIWYFNEGYNFRIKELPIVNDDNYTKYIVPIDDVQIEFFKSNATGRWWMKPGSDKFSGHQNHLPLGLMPCNQKEYVEATQGIIPERWWKSYRKSMQ
ncbi:MAG: formimidoylglutamase [Capnocytophaga felis]|nr:formimidoylglutamase [Capnocytophaga felis]